MKDAYLCLAETIGCCDPMATLPPGTAPPAPPAPATDPPDSCSAKVEAYNQCFDDGLNRLELLTCQTCINGAIPDDIDELSCEDLQFSICRAATQCSCGSCQDEVKDFMECRFSEMKPGCVINCDDPPSAPPPDSPIGVDMGFCLAEKDEMDDCLSLVIAGLDAEEPHDPSQKIINSCAACIIDTIPPTFMGKSCWGINKEICEGVEQCSCSSICHGEIHRFLDCVVDVNTAGCNVNCEALQVTPDLDGGTAINGDGAYASSNGGSGSDASSSAAVPFGSARILTAGLLVISSWLLLVRN